MEDVPDSKDYSFPGEELKILEFWDEVRIAGGGKIGEEKHASPLA